MTQIPFVVYEAERYRQEQTVKGLLCIVGLLIACLFLRGKNEKSTERTRHNEG